MTDIRSNSLLTEHLGYPPISVVDDVINSVNEIMYKCTQAVEDYLQERQGLMIEELNKAQDDVVMEGEASIPKGEIELGTAKLETLLESSVDRNFDLFELYSLRNIFSIPTDLIQDGWFKLEHHKDLSQRQIHRAEVEEELFSLQKEIQTQLALKKSLGLQKAKISKIHQILRLYSDCIRFLTDNPNYDKVKPMKENLHFVASQLRNLFADLVKIQRSIEDSVEMPQNERDLYIEAKAQGLLRNLGLDDNDDN